MWKWSEDSGDLGGVCTPLWCSSYYDHLFDEVEEGTHGTGAIQSYSRVKRSTMCIEGKNTRCQEQSPLGVSSSARRVLGKNL